MDKFPVDAPKRKVVKALESLGFRMLRESEHISMERQNPDGSKTPCPIDIFFHELFHHMVPGAGFEPARTLRSSGF